MLVHLGFSLAPSSEAAGLSSLAFSCEHESRGSPEKKKTRTQMNAQPQCAAFLIGLATSGRDMVITPFGLVPETD
jgi:hypothetical protein